MILAMYILISLIYQLIGHLYYVIVFLNIIFPLLFRLKMVVRDVCGMFMEIQALWDDVVKQ